MNRISASLKSAAAFVLSSAPAMAFALTDQTPGGGSSGGGSTIAAPELDPSSAAAVVVLLIGVALMVHRRTVRA